MAIRVPVTTPADPSILGEKLHFATSKKSVENRFLKAALTEKLLKYDKSDLKNSGIPNERYINLYSKWAHGGFGMILTGNVMVDPHHLEAPGNAIMEKSLDTPARREAFKKVVKTMKSGGSLAVVQLNHTGRQTFKGVNRTPYGASDIGLSQAKFAKGNRLNNIMDTSTILKLFTKMIFSPCMITNSGFGQPVALTLEQVKTEVIDKFVYAAKYCYECGFDGIQLHDAHGYLLAQFVSPTTNNRTDKYGGSWQNRIRLILEIYDAIRAEIPPETGFIVGIKMNSVEFQDQGLQNDEAVLMAQEFEKKGFDFIELSGGTYEKFHFSHENESTKKREAYFLEFAKKIKPALSKTVVYLTGGFRTVPGMVNALDDDVCDGIGLGRPIISEPDLPKKILQNEVQSALINPFEKGSPGEFVLGNIAANTQMWQAGGTSYEESKNDLCHGIMDLSDPKVAKKYIPRIQWYLPDMTEAVAYGYPSVLEYKCE